MLMWSVHRVSGNVLRLASTYPTCLLSSRVPLSIGWPVQGSVLVICEDGLVMSPRHIVMAACWGAHVFLRKVGLHCSSCHYAMQDDHLTYQFHKEIVIQLIVRIKIGIQHLIQYDAGKWVSPFFLVCCMILSSYGSEICMVDIEFSRIGTKGLSVFLYLLISYAAWVVAFTYRLLLFGLSFI